MALSFTKLLIITIVMTILCHCNGEKVKQTNLVFFLQDVAKGPNATVSPVIGLEGKVWSYNTFGTIFVADDPITLAPNRNSTPVGRAQGLLIASSLDGSNVNVMISIVFTNLQYNGSTLEIQGISRQLEDYREVSVVSGTGRFRFARGYATFETLFYDPPTAYSLIRLTITLLEA